MLGEELEFILWMQIIEPQHPLALVFLGHWEPRASTNGPVEGVGVVVQNSPLNTSEALEGYSDA